MRRFTMVVICLLVVACAPNRPPGVAWAPRQGEPWQWQLTGPLDLSVDVPVYDVDWEQTPARSVARLHADGRRVICYVSVGSWEPDRPDAEDFPGPVRGRPLADFPEERWLDVRRLDVLGPLLTRRFDTCRAKGFDAVEPDNVDGYANPTGFALTAADQLRFNRWIAAQVRARGMAVALKNDVEQVEALEPHFDFAVNEECAAYDECERLRPFLDAGKAVLHVEYELPLSRFCPLARRLGLSSMRKTVELTAWRRPCR